MVLKEYEKTYKEFGSFVKSARKNRHLTQGEVAEKLNISQSYYSCIEKGTRKLSLPMAIRVCEVLNLDLNEFIISLTMKQPPVIRPED